MSFLFLQAKSKKEHWTFSVFPLRGPSHIRVAQFLNVVHASSRLSLSTPLLEVEAAHPGDSEVLFDIQSSLSSPTLEDGILGAFPIISVPCKLEPHTQELASTSMDTKEIMSSTVCRSGGVIHSKFLDPKTVGGVKATRSICSKSFGNPPRDKSCNCYVCLKRFSRQSDLNTHQKVQTSEKPFKCDVCKKSFSQLNTLNVHYRIHTGEKPFKCGVCEKDFSQSNHLNDHHRIHTGEKPFKCGVCEKDFSHLASLKSHQRIHTGEKPFKCDVCKKSFSELSTLKSHHRIHTGEKPFKCGVCEKDFSHLASLKSHQRIHTGEKPFKCDVCKKSFSELSTLKSHHRIHTREKLLK
ncbi:zinc finger protein 664-like isoform X1 [Artemia franciscana]|uniref:zinc finger protein 664-like isoform X1 n=1 Tax=Artemia franciscana TaxID=6661 RepID=UPI0032DB5CEB